MTLGEPDMGAACQFPHLQIVNGLLQSLPNLHGNTGCARRVALVLAAGNESE
jgi:hypothetical protein